MSTVKLVTPKDALLWLEFGGQYTNGAGKRVIDNLAERGDAPATVQCGDGTTSTKFPTQLSKRGLSFDGGDYLDAALTDRFERTTRFSMFVAVSGFVKNANRTLFSTRSGGAAYFSWYHLNGYWVVDIVNTWGTNHLQQACVASSSLGVETLCLTYSGGSAPSSCAYYVNGAAVSMSNGANTLTSSILSGGPLLIGAVNSGSTNFYLGNMHHASVFGDVLSPLQVSNLHKRVMRRINLP